MRAKAGWNGGAHVLSRLTMARALKILVADDDREKRFLVAHHLAGQFEGVEILECDSGAAAIDILREQKVHALVTDNSMGPVNGLELIKWVRERDVRLPVVMVTGNPEIEKLALESGASIVVTSGRFSEVGPILKQLFESEV